MRVVYDQAVCNEVMIVFNGQIVGSLRAFWCNRYNRIPVDLGISEILKVGRREKGSEFLDRCAAEAFLFLRCCTIKISDTDA